MPARPPTCWPRAALSATVADARFAKPLDVDLILRLAREHEALITVEEGAMGGFGAFVLQLLAEHGALDRGLKIRTLTLPDVFQDQDKPEAMYAQAGLDADGIAARRPGRPRRRRQPGGESLAASSFSSFEGRRPNPLIPAKAGMSEERARLHIGALQGLKRRNSSSRTQL